MLPLGVMDRAFGIGANFAQFAFLRAFGDDSLGSLLTGLVLRPVALILALGLVLADFDVLVARNRRTAVGGFSEGGANLYQLRFGRHGLLHVLIDFPLVAGGIGALLAALPCPL